MNQNPRNKASKHLTHKAKLEETKKAFHRCKGNVAKTARLLGVSQQTVKHRLRKMRSNPVWEAYFADPSEENRNKVAAQHVEWVSMLALTFAAKLPPDTSADDLMQEGNLALLDAIKGFDPKKASFESFAIRRIKGAMMDFLRKTDPATRTMRRREKIRKETEAKLGTDAKEVVSDHLGWGNDEWRGSFPPVIVSLNKDRNTNNPEIERTTNVDREMEPTYEHDFSRPFRIREALRHLTPDDFVITYLYYFKAKTMKEIAAILDIGEAAVSLRHTRILKEFRMKNQDRILEILK